MMSRSALRLTALSAFALLALLSACSEDDSSVTGPGDGDLKPLSASYWPHPEEGATWSYLRAESGVFSPDTLIDYYNPDLPAGYSELELMPGFVDVNGEAARVLRSRFRQYLGNPVQHGLDLWLDPGGDQVRLLGEDTSNDVDSSYVFTPQLPYPWLRFGDLRWTLFSVDYAADSMNIGDEYGYGEDKQGKVLVEDALGFDYPRLIYNGENIPGQFPYDQSDVDYDTYPDGIASIALVGEVIDEIDFARADLGALCDSLFGPLFGDSPQDLSEYEAYINTRFENCRWVRFSLEMELFLSNQRDPNAPPGQNSVNEFYISDQSGYAAGRKDLSVMLLAPNLGPLIVINYIDLDKQLKVETGDAKVRVFQPDLIQTDYLMDSSLLP